MRFEMKMPDLATTGSEIRIVRWLVEQGENVQRGQSLLEVETDKATMEVESVACGVLRDVCFGANDTVSVGEVIAVLDVEETTPQSTSPAAPPASTPNAVAAPAEPIVRPGVGAGGMFARNRATASAPAAPAGIPLSVAERAAAQRLQESKQTVPHFYLQTSVNASAMIAQRQGAPVGALVWDAFFVQAVAKAMARFERFRHRLAGERLVPIESDAIGVAVDHNDDLYVIPVASPATQTVAVISEAIRLCVARLRDGDPEMRRTRPTLLTVTNLGACNVESFIPIINPPEPAILGIGKVRPTPVVRADGSLAVEPRCTLTLSVDHRVASGKYAARFLDTIVSELEGQGRSTS